MKKENLQPNRGLICTASPRRLWRVRLGDTSRRTRRTAPSRPASDLTFSRTKRVTRAQKPRAPRGVDRPHRELSRPIRSGGSTRRETRPPRQRASFVSPCGLARIQSCTWRKKKTALAKSRCRCRSRASSTATAARLFLLLRRGRNPAGREPSTLRKSHAPPNPPFLLIFPPSLPPSGRASLSPRPNRWGRVGGGEGRHKGGWGRR